MPWAGRDRQRSSCGLPRVTVLLVLCHVLRGRYSCLRDSAVEGQQKERESRAGTVLLLYLAARWFPAI